GFALSGVAGQILGSLSADAAVTMSTLITGTAWAWLFRRRSSVAITAALAGLNAGLTGLLSTGKIGLALAYVVFGVILWGPAALLAFVVFGLPRKYASEFAKHGLASEEFGERSVALVTLAVSLVSILLTLRMSKIWAPLATSFSVVAFVLATLST